jgi:hypothetical protein
MIMNIRALTPVVLLGLIIVLPISSIAFEFDIWKSGISLDDALEIAKSNDIPLTDVKRMKHCQRGKDHFQPDTIKHAQKSRNFFYKDSILNKTALITLHFTPMSKKLCNISIIWDNADRAHQKEVVLMLTEKYAEPLKFNPIKDHLSLTPDIRFEGPISKSQFFASGSQDLITVHSIVRQKTSLIVLYNDLPIRKQEKNEEQAFQQFLKTRYQQQSEDRM